MSVQRQGRLRAFRVTTFVTLGLFFLVPLLSMLDFSTRMIGGGRTWDNWEALWTNENLRTAIITSLLLALFTVLLMLVLLLPTMIWVRLQVPQASRLVEFLCLLPLTVPALVIVVGIAPVYAWVTYFLGDSALTLTFAYVVLVLPYAYRALDAGLAAIDVQTLSEAARGLGAGWGTVITRVVAPNLTSAILSASFISVALVLGEYTFASLLNFQNLQVVIALLGKSDAGAAVAASLASLLFASLLLIAFSFLGRGPRRSKEG